MVDANKTGPRPAHLPLYKQVKDHILGRIRSGHLEPGSRIPSENELVETFNVSRMTVHRALRELAEEGVLLRVQGVGTFAAPSKPQSSLVEIVSIAEEIRRQGGIHSSVVHLLREEPAPPWLGRRMRLSAGSAVFHALLVHCDRGLPVQLADRYVNPAIAPRFLEQDFTRMTPSDYLLAIAPVTEVDHVIEAVLADKPARSLLQLPQNTPCLLLHRTTWSGPQVCTFSRFTYPGPRFRLGGRFAPNQSHPRPTV